MKTLYQTCEKKSIQNGLKLSKNSGTKNIIENYWRQGKNTLTTVVKPLTKRTIISTIRNHISALIFSL